MQKIKDAKDIYLMGIGGIAMGNLAGMLKAIGKNVRGSDKEIYSPMKEYLQSLNIDIKIGFNPSNLAKVPDLVVVGNVISRDNPEIKEVLRRNIPYISMPECIRMLFLEGKSVIVVAGTHGKTTTTALLGWLLTSSSKDPGIFLGGLSKNLNSGFRIGRGELFVIEGDEYDTAFFDKKPKFLHYMPGYLALTTIEFDHGDIYRDINEIKRAFSKLVALVPDQGFIAYGSYSENNAELVKALGCEKASCGEGGDWSFLDPRIVQGWTEFLVLKGGERFGKFRWRQCGIHNIRNALLAIALSDRLGLSYEEIKRGMESFEGVKRRQEEIGEFSGILIIDDFAHHPTEVRETIASMRLKYPDRRLWAVFEPRSNTSRRNFFQALYPQSFMAADKIIISGVYNKDKINQEERLDPEKITIELKSHNKDALFIDSVDEIVQHLKERAKRGDLILCMSNGGFGGIIEKLKEAFS